MSQDRKSFATDAFEMASCDQLTMHGLVSVYSCGRIGRVANPPTFSLTDWFRSARRR